MSDSYHHGIKVVEIDNGTRPIGWWEGTQVYDAVAVCIPDLHPYSRLFVRFSNLSVVDGRTATAQPVFDYGGNPSLSVERVINYPHIARLTDV